MQFITEFKLNNFIVGLYSICIMVINWIYYGLRNINASIF